MLQNYQKIDKPHYLAVKLMRIGSEKETMHASICARLLAVSIIFLPVQKLLLTRELTKGCSV